MRPCNLRSLRRARHLTPAQLAAQLGVHPSTVSRWERGRHHPRPHHAALLQRLLGLGRVQKSAAHSPRGITSTTWRDGPGYRLALADCFDILPSLPAASVDALITDPPYSSGGLHASERSASARRKYEQTDVRRHRLDFDGDQRDQRSWIRWCVEWLRLCRRALKPGAIVAVFCDWRQLPALTDAIQMADLIWRGTAIWDKTEGARPAPGRPRNQCEFIVWGSKGALPTDRGVPVLPGLHREAIRQRDKHHLAGKPIAVMRWLCKLCLPGGLILDPFAGSGSTGAAALLEGRSFLGIEREPHHCEIAARRLDAAARGLILSAQQSGGAAA